MFLNTINYLRYISSYNKDKKKNKFKKVVINASEHFILF